MSLFKFSLPKRSSPFSFKRTRSSSGGAGKHKSKFISRDEFEKFERSVNDKFDVILDCLQKTTPQEAGRQDEVEEQRNFERQQEPWIEVGRQDEVEEQRNFERQQELRIEEEESEGDEWDRIDVVPEEISSDDETSVTQARLTKAELAIRRKKISNEIDFLTRTANLHQHINPHISFGKQETAILGVVVPLIKKHLRKEGVVSSTELIVDVLRGKHKYLRSKTKKLSNNDKIASIRRIKANNRSAEKRRRRQKAAAELWKAGDERLSQYERWELVKILQEPAYHSPEPSPERRTVNAASVAGENGHESIKVYDIAQRSVELRELLRYLEKYELEKSKAKILRTRTYDDDNQVMSVRLPRDAPAWCRRTTGDDLYVDAGLPAASPHDVAH